MKKVVAVILLIALLFSLTSCKDKDDYISKNQIMLDTIVNIKIYDDDINEKMLDEIMEYIAMLEKKLSISVEGSDIWRINENSGQWLSVSDETIELIQQSKAISKMSNGHFDISAGPLINLWAISPPEGYYPTKEEIDWAKGQIDYQKIQIDGNKIKIENDMAINLGAIAKGYIADKVKLFMEDKGIEYGIINLGGNVLLINQKPSGDKFRIGVAKPYASKGELLGTFALSDMALVSSGIYERYFIYEGEEYHHILNPFKGYPENNNLEAVSIVSKSATLADAYSTAVFLLGENEGLDLVEQDENIEAVFVTKDKKIILSSGLEGEFDINVESNYILVTK